MKKLLFLFVLVFSLSSCLDNEDTNYAGQFLGVVDLLEGSALGYELVLDGGRHAIPTLSNVDYTAKDNDRVYLFLEILNDDRVNPLDVKVMTIESLPTYDVVTYNPAVDTLGSDEVAVDARNVWQSCNYLNINFSYQQGYTPQRHTFDLVYYPDSIGEDGETFLKFQHQANNDLNEESATGYKCFNMSSIAVFAEATDSVNFIIKVNAGTYNGASDLIKGTYYVPK